MGICVMELEKLTVAGFVGEYIIKLISHDILHSAEHLKFLRQRKHQLKIQCRLLLFYTGIFSDNLYKCLYMC